MELKTTTWHVDEGIGVLTLSRPAAHNAWTGRMHTELRHLLAAAEDDPAIGVVVITGDPAGATFCPGGDATALAGHAERGAYDPGTPADLAEPGYGVDPAFDADFAFLLGMETVTIAAVNGAAAGVGFALACWCDVRFVADDAKLTSAHGRLNLPAEYGLSWILPRLIGRGRAVEILLSSRIVMGTEAAAIGLATASTARDRVLDTALAHARSLVTEISPHALRATKRQLAVDAVHDDPARAVRDAQARLEQMMTEDDYREGAAALNERRPPRWHQP
jgi:enoyl-CoA hydratase/carnithine racemase